MATDPKRSWLEQPVEVSAPAPEALRAQVRKLRRRVLISNLLEYGAALILVLVAVRSLLRPTSWLRVVADLTMIACVLFVCYFLHRRRVPEILPGLDSLQYAARAVAQLERQRAYLTQSWRWYLGPLLPPLAFHIAANTLESGRDGLSALEIVNALIAVAVVAAIFVAVRYYHKRGARKFQEEIEVMRRLEPVPGAAESPPAT